MPRCSSGSTRTRSWSWRRSPRPPASPASWPPTTTSPGCPRRARRRSSGTCCPRSVRPRPATSAPGVTAPTFRWHPAMVAQASATLAAMYPGATGWASAAARRSTSTSIGQYWPEAPERINRMFEAVEIIKKLYASGLAGKDVRHEGQYYRLESTRLWTMPETAPEVLVATAGPVAAKRAGRMADGLITEAAPIDKVGAAAAALRRGREGVRPRCCHDAEGAAPAPELGGHGRGGDAGGAHRVAERRDAVRQVATSARRSSSSSSRSSSRRPTSRAGCR